MESGEKGIQTERETKKMLHKFCGQSDLCYLCKQIKLFHSTFASSLFLNAEAQREKEYMTHVYGERTRRNAKAFRRVRRAVRRSLCPLQAAGLLSVLSYIQYDIKKSLRLCVEC